MRIKVIIELLPEDVWKLDLIGQKGTASSGYRQDWDFCLRKAIIEFIKKYEEK